MRRVMSSNDASYDDHQYRTHFLRRTKQINPRCIVDWQRIMLRGFRGVLSSFFSYGHVFCLLSGVTIEQEHANALPHEVNC